MTARKHSLSRRFCAASPGSLRPRTTVRKPTSAKGERICEGGALPPARACGPASPPHSPGASSASAGRRRPCRRRPTRAPSPTIKRIRVDEPSRPPRPAPRTCAKCHASHSCRKAASPLVSRHVTGSTAFRRQSRPPGAEIAASTPALSAVAPGCPEARNCPAPSPPAERTSSAAERRRTRSTSNASSVGVWRSFENSSACASTARHEKRRLDMAAGVVASGGPRLSASSSSEWVASWVSLLTGAVCKRANGTSATTATQARTRNRQSPMLEPVELPGVAAASGEGMIA